MPDHTVIFVRSVVRPVVNSTLAAVVAETGRLYVVPRADVDGISDGDLIVLASAEDNLYAFRIVKE